jgi:hypothetical protein
MNTLLKNIELNTNEIDGNGLLAGKSGYIILVLYKSVWVAQFGLIKEKSSLPVKT